ncbi:hypothetical protein lerEdw1_007418 [Lerista edwardsae]|nr:hypothetical protein lerEdw1_007418 [Lerista edwardsae]
MVQLTVTPESSLADVPVSIRASGLTPFQMVTLYLWLTDEKEVKFESRAFYQANEAGEVDVKEACAQGGDYSGVWPMGLFCSMKPVKLFHRLIKLDVIGSPFRVHISLFDSFVFLPSPDKVPLVECTVERWYAAPGVKRFQVKEGQVRGALFLPPGPGPFPGVIDMFGGSGGLIEFRASLLASKGFAVLALAFFAYDDLPAVLAKIDLEYFEEATKLLLNHPMVRGPGLGAIGLSKGAEIALAMCTFLEQIVAVVCINGTTTVAGVPLHFRDICIPAIPYYGEKVLVTDPGVLTNCHVMGDPREEKHQACIIPLEKALGHVLFVVGEDDRSIDSKLFAEMALARAKKHGKNNCTLLHYPGAGHLIEPPGSPLSNMTTIRGSPKPIKWGGKPEPHAKAQEHSWKEIETFFKHHLGPAGNSNL